MATAKYTDIELFRRSLRQAQPYAGHIVAFLLLSLLSTPIALLAPVPLKIAVDSVVGSEPLPRLLTTVVPAGAGKTAVLVLSIALLIAVAVLSQLQKAATSLLYTYTGEKLALAFRSRLFRHAQRLSLLYHDRARTTDSAYRILWDGAAIRHIALDGLTPFITAGFTLISMIWIIFRLDPLLALIALVVAPALFLLTRLFRDRLRGQWRDVKDLEANGLSVVQEALSAIRVVKAFGQETREEDRFLRRAEAGVQARIRATLSVDAFGMLVAIATTVGTATVLFVGVKHVQTDVLTLGELLIVMAYLTELYGPLKAISKNIGGLQAHLASAERALALLDEVPDVVERPKPRSIRRAAGEVVFRNICFAYERSGAALRDVSFEVPAGTRVGIAGRTGAGKSTLASLMLRFYDPTSGEILLDGVDLREYKVADLRNQFSLVLQEPLLFSTAIAENIAYARPEASRDQIIAAAKAAGAHRFIAGLPDGYDTQVGERGVQLSGGERQRIALARAFLKDAPILVLDEPTSSVDLETESDIIDSLERLMEGQTTFLIAHRLTTLARCDVLFLIEGGRLVTIRRDVASTIGEAIAAGGLEALLQQESKECRSAESAIW